MPWKTLTFGFLVILGAARVKEYNSLTKKKKINSAPHFLQPPAFDKEPNSRARNVCQMARKSGHTLHNEDYRANYRYLDEFLNTVFNHFPLEIFFFLNQEELIILCPRAHFRQKFKIDKKPKLHLWIMTSLKWHHCSYFYTCSIGIPFRLSTQAKMVFFPNRAGSQKEKTPLISLLNVSL